MKRLIVSVLLVVVATSLCATRIRRLSLSEISDAAPAVLVVEVLGSAARTGSASMIWTDYRVRIAEVLRGRHAPREEMTLSFAGGRAGGRDVGIAGVPLLEKGKRYLIFMDDAPGRPVPAVGWGDGIFPLGSAEEPITSVAGERLVIDGEGWIDRRRDLGSPPRRLAPPMVIDSGGVVRRWEGPPPPRSRWHRDATLDDLRRFVEGSTSERRDRGPFR